MIVEAIKVSGDVEKRDRNWMIRIHSDLERNGDVMIECHREVILVKDGKKWSTAGNNGECQYMVSKLLSQIMYDTVTLPAYAGGITLSAGQIALALEMLSDRFADIKTTAMSPNIYPSKSGEFVLTIDGSVFQKDSVVRWNGKDLQTTFVSAARITATVTEDLLSVAGTAKITVFTAASGVETPGLPFIVEGITSISPKTCTSGSAGFTLKVDGPLFKNDSIVRWNGTDLETTYVETTQLTAVVTSELLATAGSVNVTIFQDGAESASEPFTIEGITAISPDICDSGSKEFTLTIDGLSFQKDSIVRWNGKDLETTFINSTQLTVLVKEDFVAAPGTAEITVFQNKVESSKVPFVIK